MQAQEMGAVDVPENNKSALDEKRKQINIFLPQTDDPGLFSQVPVSVVCAEDCSYSQNKDCIKEAGRRLNEWVSCCKLMTRNWEGKQSKAKVKSKGQNDWGKA